MKPNLNKLLIEARKIGAETLKFTEWYINEVENEGLLEMQVTTSKSVSQFLNGEEITKEYGDIEEFCAELNRMHEAPSFPSPDFF